MGLCRYRAVVFLLIASTAQQLPAKGKRKTRPLDQDQISVAAHVAVTGGPIVRFMATSHYGRSYVYAERAPGQPITLLDITNPDQPQVISQLTSGQLPSEGAGALNLAVVSGTAVISTSAPPESGPKAPQTVRLLDFSDPAHPKLTRQFDDVSAVERISSTVTLLANPDGVWVLKNHLAPNPEDEERYARKVIYGESRY